MKKIVYAVGLITFILLSLYFSIIIIDNPFIGIGIKYTTEGKWEVSKIEEHSWAENNNIVVGQEIITINHKPPGEWLSVKIYNAIGKASHLQMVEDGVIKDVQINSNLNNHVLYFHLVIPIIFIFITIIFGWKLYRDEKQNKLTYILFLLINLFGIAYLSAGAAVRGDIFAQFFVTLSLLIIPTLFLHLLNLFFTENYKIKLISNNVIYSFYILCTIIMLVKCYLTSMQLNQYFQYYSQLVSTIFIFIIIVILYNILRFYIKTRNTVITPTIKIIMATIMISFSPFVFGDIIPDLVFKQSLISGEFAASFMYLIPMSLFYLIMTNKLLDIDFVINRLQHYCYLTVLLFIPINLFLLFFYKFTLFELSQFSIIFFPLNVMFLFFKDRLEYKFRNRLFSKKGNLNIRAQNLVRFMSKIMKRSEFDNRLIEEIKSVLSVSEVFIYELSKNKENSEVLINKLIDEVVAQIQVGTYRIAELYQVKSGYFIVIGDSSDITTILVIGNKNNNMKLNEDEKEWLTTISYLTYIAYENLQHIDELFQKIKVLENKNDKYPWLSRLIFNLQETERRKIANDLHDTILQEQLVLHQKIGMILNKYHLSNEVREKLIEIQDGFMDAIFDIRETCYELRPPFLLEVGLVKAIDNYIRKVQLRNNFIVEFDYERLDIEIDEEHTSHLYRIVQELLNNASKHSLATKVNIILSSEDDVVFLKYEDNGKGIIDTDENSNSDKIGLSGIKERVSSLEGMIEIKSEQNKGLEVIIRIPLTTKVGAM